MDLRTAMKASSLGAVRDTIAVIGAASRYNDAQIIAAFEIGREIGRLGFNLVTGMTLGAPYAAAIGAKSEGAVVVGVSPAASREEHVRQFQRPLDCIDVAIYTGMGLEGRQPVLVRSAKGAIVVGGEFGTLAEFSAAWTTGSKILGVLEGVGGISDFLRVIIAQTESRFGSTVLYDTQPETLVRNVCRQVKAQGDFEAQLEIAAGFGSSVRNTIDAHLHSVAIASPTGSRQ